MSGPVTFNLRTHRDGEDLRQVTGNSSLLRSTDRTAPTFRRPRILVADPGGGTTASMKSDGLVYVSAYAYDASN